MANKVSRCSNCGSTNRGHEMYQCTNKNCRAVYCDKTKTAMFGDCPKCGLGTFIRLEKVV